MKTPLLKPALLTAAVAAVLVLAAPLVAEAHSSGKGGNGNGYSRHNGFPQFDFRFFLPQGSLDRHRHDHRQFQAMPQRAVKRMLRRQHFHHIRHLTLRGDAYHARAKDSFGRNVFLKIDASNGLVIRLRYRN
jgi:hypothetical protein